MALVTTSAQIPITEPVRVSPAADMGTGVGTNGEGCEAASDLSALSAATSAPKVVRNSSLESRSTWTVAYTLVIASGT